MPSTIIITGATGRLGQACTQAYSQAHWRVLPYSVQAQGAPQQTLPASAAVLLHAANPVYTQWATQALPALQQSIDMAVRMQSLLMLRQATRTQGLRCVVLRAGDFFGSGKGSWFDLALASKLQKGQFVYPGPLDVPHAWAYLPDLALAFVKLAQQRTQLAAFESLHFAGHTLTGQDWLQALTPIAQAQGWLGSAENLRTKSLPWPLMKALSPVMPLWRELLEMRYLWQEPHALVGDKLQQRIGNLAHTALLPAVLGALQALAMVPRKQPENSSSTA